jgi:hypothetical protein
MKVMCIAFILVLYKPMLLPYVQSLKNQENENIYQICRHRLPVDELCIYTTAELP